MLERNRFPGRLFQRITPRSRIAMKWFSGVALVLVCFSVCLAAEFERQWPIYRGDALGTGTAAEPLADQLDVAWKFSDQVGPIEATPTIQNNVVYVGDVDGNVFALDLLTGKLIWRQKFETGFVAAASVDNDLLFLGDYDGGFRALRTTDGSVCWEITTQAQIDAGAAFYKDLVLITSQDGSLYALERTTGNQRWEYATGDQLRCSPTVVENRTFLGGCDAKLHLVDLDTGEKAAEALPLGSPTGSTPTVSGDVVFVPTYGGQVFAVDWHTNKEVWLFADPKVVQEIAVSAAIKDDVLVGIGKNRRVIAWDAKNGKILWQSPLKKRADAAPVISDSRVWIASTDGRLSALDLRSGELRWQYEFGGQLLASPAIASGRLVIGTDKQGIVCFAAKP